MNRQLFSWLAFAALLAGSAVCSDSFAQSASTSVDDHYTSYHIGSTVPAIAGVDLRGQPVSIGYAQARYTLVNFFFATCVECIAELPKLKQLSRRFPSLRVVGVTFDAPADTAAFVRQYDLRYQVVSSAKPFIDRSSVHFYPTQMLVDRHGKLLGDYVGGIAISDGKPVDVLTPWVKRVIHSR